MGFALPAEIAGNFKKLLLPVESGKSLSRQVVLRFELNALALCHQPYVAAQSILPKLVPPSGSSAQYQAVMAREESIVTTAMLERSIGKPWRSISGKLMNNKKFKLQLESEGWRYVSVKGKKGSYLQRITTDKSLGAQVDPEHETAPLSVAMMARAA
ncbi:MAG TPA: hypothetical protein VGJ01_14770 [Pseudolabrys sp.]